MVTLFLNLILWSGQEKADVDPGWLTFYTPCNLGDGCRHPNFPWSFFQTPWSSLWIFCHAMQIKAPRFPCSTSRKQWIFGDHERCCYVSHPNTEPLDLISHFCDSTRFPAWLHWLNRANNAYWAESKTTCTFSPLTWPLVMSRYRMWVRYAIFHGKKQRNWTNQN